jgi:hypothetical protein
MSGLRLFAEQYMLPAAVGVDRFKPPLQRAVLERRGRAYREFPSKVPGKYRESDA